MIEIKYNSPLNVGETVYFLENEKIKKGTLVRVTCYFDEHGQAVSYFIALDNGDYKVAARVFKSQEELIDAIKIEEE